MVRLALVFEGWNYVCSFYEKYARGQFTFAVSPWQFSLFLTGCNKPATPGTAGETTIKVGEFASLTGSEATFGQSSATRVRCGD